MKLVPIPTTDEHIKRSAPVWLPFVEGISRRSKEPVESLIDQIIKRDVQVLLAWDESLNKASALAGIKFWRRGPDLIGDIIWCTGSDRKTWQYLVAEIERYLKDVNCVECRPICRPGWSRLLLSRGYKITHYVMEKML